MPHSPFLEGPVRERAPLLALATLVVLVVSQCAPDSDRAPLQYPEAPRGDQVDLYHGTEVADPYRWLEELESDATRTWVAAQNELAQPRLEAIPERNRIVQRLTAIWNHERYSTPFEENGVYFFFKNDGLQNQSVLYAADDLHGEPRVVLDPNAFSEDGTVSLAGLSVSPDARYLAYAKSDGGSDWDTWHVRSLQSGEDLPDLIRHTKFTTASWSRDGKGFYYSRYPTGADGEGDDQKAVAIYYHRANTPQREDRLVYEIPEHPRRNPYGEVTEDGRFLVITVQEGYLTNAVHYLRLDRPEAPVVELLAEWDARYSFLGNLQDRFYFQTNLEAPRERIVAVDIRRPERKMEIVPQQDATLAGSAMIGGHLITETLEDAKSKVWIRTVDGEPLREVELPGIGTVGGFAGDWDDPETFYSFTSFTAPTAVYRYDVATGETSLFKRPEVDVDFDAFETSQVFFESADGTRVPMFLVHREGLERDGSRPTLLYGYGGFNVSLTPSFSMSRMVWLEMGGVLAIPNLRGGGEYGREWHLAGTRAQKQNVFDDFIAAAEWLIANDYTSPSKLAIQGGSNGGLLVGAAITQRPDLFGAALPAVGVLDMLRYHLASANARNWSTDYGLSENEEDFRAQLAYSPLHNVEEGTCYPPTLVTTADHDDRVVPWHSYKFGAALQHAQGCAHPILVRVETRAGHGAGTPTWMQIEKVADQWAFLVKHLEMEPFEEE